MASRANHRVLLGCALVCAAALACLICTSSTGAVAEGAAALVGEAHRRGMRVHLETNGTVAPSDARGDAFFDWVVVSPKPPGYAIAGAWDGLIDELKLVVDDRMDAATAERLAAAQARGL